MTKLPCAPPLDVILSGVKSDSVKSDSVKSNSVKSDSVKSDSAYTYIY